MSIPENQNKHKNPYNNYNDDGENNTNVKSRLGLPIA